MAEFVQKSLRPKVDAIQVTWAQTETIPPGTWIVKSPNGSTTYGADEWFQERYEKA